MDATRFDALTGTLHTSGTRRALSGLLGMLIGFLALLGVGSSSHAWARKKKRKNQVKAEGPCGNGSAKANRCRKDRHCCTGSCDKGKRKRGKKGKRRRRSGRCRCRKAGQSCTEDRNCCPERTGRTCIEGTCQASASCDVCASGCRYTSIQDAIDDPLAPQSIRLCAETYGGTFTITRDLALIGAGQGEDGTILDGQKRGTVVTISNGVTVDLESLRITGGEGNSGIGADGGGIYNSPGATVTLTGVSVTGNHASDDGGGIYNREGTVTLNNSTVSNNIGTNDGGGFNNFEGTVNLNDSDVTGNTANWGGGLFNDSPAVINLTNSHVTLNEAGGAGQGGGIFNGGLITISGSTIEDNDPDNCVEGITSSGGCP